MGYFIAVVGDKPIETITREDILDFRKWWVNKILSEDLATNTANKAFTNIKRLIRIATDNNSFGMPVEDMFKDIRLKGTTKAERRPFPPQYMQDVLLKHDYKSISPECRLLLFAMADTGARIKELVGLDVDNGDIVLDAEIPLVGASLYAFQELAKLNSDTGGRLQKKIQSVRQDHNKTMLQMRKDIGVYMDMKEQNKPEPAQFTLEQQNNGYAQE